MNIRSALRIMALAEAFEFDETDASLRFEIPPRPTKNTKTLSDTGTNEVDRGSWMLQQLECYPHPVALLMAHCSHKV